MTTPGAVSEVNNGSGYALFTTLTLNAAPIECVPAIIDLDLLPDMGGMTGR
jgi:hypothetical protein